nr:hypothetical protein BaRGS_015354 [Batillaria attramentaria]
MERAGKSCVDIADSLPTDLAMEARVECAAILSKKHVCGGCQTSPATSICLNCGDMMCTVCTKTHKNFSATKHHDVEDLATMTAERLAANRRLPCSVHADKTSELYCPTHGAVICQLCATSKHRACPEVTELEEKMQEARAVLAALAATLKAGESKLEGAIRELDQYLVDMEKATQAALADIDRKCDRLQSCVEACRKRMKQLAKGANCEAIKMVLAGKTVVIDEKALARIERELSQLGQLSVTPAVKVASTSSAPGVTGDMVASQAVGQTKSWRFHTNHGENIVLSYNQQTAERVRGIDAIVISKRVGKSCDDIADSLPTDLAMEARVECAAILSKDHVCSGCDTSPATSICLKCGDMMCIVCTKTHKKFSATKHHDVEDLATMTAERLAANRRLPCSVHDDEQSKLYCPTHGAAICQLCATSKHRACPEVTELEEKMQEARAVLAELAAILKVGESKLEGAISELDQYLVDMEKATQAALADIDHKCDRLQSSVEAFRKRMKQLAKGANCEAKKMVRVDVVEGDSGSLFCGVTDGDPV